MGKRPGTGYAARRGHRGAGCLATGGTGPKSDDLMVRVFGEAVREIRFFRFATLAFSGHPLIVARSGYSKQGGFEIYLDKPALGLDLWDALWQAGADLQVLPGSPNLIERVEGGLLSYGNEMTRDDNPLECGLEDYCSLDGSVDYIGRDALQRIAARARSGRFAVCCLMVNRARRASTLGR